MEGKGGGVLRLVKYLISCLGVKLIIWTGITTPRLSSNPHILGVDPLIFFGSAQSFI